MTQSYILRQGGFRQTVWFVRLFYAYIGHRRQIG